MKFSIIVDCDDNGQIIVWSQKKEKLSQGELDKMMTMLISIRKAVTQQPIKNEIQFPEKPIFKTSD